MQLWLHFAPHLQYEQREGDADGDAELAGKYPPMMRMSPGSQIAHIASQEAPKCCRALRACHCD